MFVRCWCNDGVGEGGNSDDCDGDEVMASVLLWGSSKRVMIC